jgi:signal peptidase I
MKAKQAKSGSSTGADIAGSGPSASAPRPPSSPFAWLKENVEALVVAVILALIIRHFSVEAFEIPTGSMANTLLGIHARLDCPNCPTGFDVALQTDTSSGELSVRYAPALLCREECPNPKCTLGVHAPGPGGSVVCGSCRTRFQASTAKCKQGRALPLAVRCPICHHRYNALVEDSNYIGGHKILVDKFAYYVGKPRRWDVIVFGFDPWKNYIKRLIGLPGERINIWDGDIYVDGKVERKSRRPAVQESLWTRIADSDVPEMGLAPLQGTRVEAWGEIAPDGAGRKLGGGKNAAWNGTTLRWSLNAPGDLAILEYQRGFDNYCPYNLNSGLASEPPGIQVGDKRVTFTARIAATTQGTWRGESWIGAEIRDGDYTFQLRVPVGGPGDARKTVLERLRGPGAPADWKPMVAEAPRTLAVGQEATIVLANADDRVSASLDGEELFALEYTSLPEGSSLAQPPPEPGQQQAAHHVRLIASGIQAELRSIRVDRDMYYIPSAYRRSWEGIQLGPGEYLAMGDNAPSSSDGRYWGSVPEKNLMGRALCVFWPAWPTNFQCQFIR